MFVNPKILKRLMKEAFKANSLIIGRKEDNMFIQGQYWQFLCDRKFVNKTIYAEIIELAGEIPDEGECFCAGKGGNQAFGPFCNLGHGVLWKNNTGKFRVLFRQDDEHENLLEQLACVDLTEKNEELQ